ncbi:MAG: hypothetical protein HY785_13010 [Oscillatoriophycideae cyanobacterium NC_groundwater_1537_Pr4_S-0.65um_50_18]|nr:hypothetical protein [Oscillatoriophycideae cyanobacterium NC_groundwater_1537_Pr4_S-0.65um_50_18]
MSSQRETQQIAAQLLSGLLSNPHIYASVSDEGTHGQQEQQLMAIAIEMAECIIGTVNERSHTSHQDESE